jgi:hypothetical protein
MIMKIVKIILFTIDCKDVHLRELVLDDLEEFHSLTWQSEIHCVNC